MRLIVILCAFLCEFAPAQSSKTAPADTGILLRGGTIHTVSGPVIEHGVVLMRNGKIVAVGRNITTPEGYKVIDVTGKDVYPGMIDAASTLGIESLSKEEAPDSQEMGLINPQLRAVTAVNPSDEQIPAARFNGVTSVIEMPEGDLLSGEMSIIHLDDSGDNGAMTVMPATAIHLRFPAITTHPIRPHETDEEDEDPSAQPAPIPYADAKRDYDLKMKTLNTFFDEARQYRQAKRADPKALKTDLRYEAILPVLDGATPLFVTAARERTIRDAVQWSKKEKIKIILADAYEAYKVLPLLKANDIPVVLGPTHSLPLDEDDSYDQSYTTPGQLYKAGVRFCIGTFSSRNARNLPYEAAAAVPFGLPKEEAYKAVSLSTAQIFGIANRLGSIEEGKSADIIVSEGNPLEVMSHIDMMFIDGKPVSLDSRQKELYEKYLGRH